MRLPSLFSAIVFLGFAGASSLPAAEPIKHRFLCSDYSGGKVCIVGADGKIEWEFPAKIPQDCWMLPNGNVLFSHGSGAKEVTMQKEVVWEYKGPEGVEIHAAQPLADGNVMIIECGTKRIIEVNRAGEIVKEVPLNPNPKVGTHGQFRGGRKLANGHYVVPFYSERKVVELDGNGTVVREVPVAGNPSGIAPLRNGHWVVTNGDGHQVLEIAPDGKTVWQLSENDLTGNPIRFAIGVQRLPNGNTVFCNWLGHGHIGENPHLYEVTPDKQLVWSFADHAHFKAVSQVQILDEGSLAKPWELER